LGTFNKKKRIWITGKNGFIGGSILANKYFKKFELISTSRKEVDLNNSVQVNKFLKKFKPEIIINTSGLVGGIIRNKNEKYELLSNNIKASLNLIDQVYCNYNGQTFINLSSSCIYPNNINKKIKENQFDLNNIEKSSEYYALAKIVSFKMCHDLNERGLNFHTLIPSNLYGPRDDFSERNSHVIGSLIRKFHKLQNSEINLLGSGIAKRDFLYIDDFVNAIFKFISSNKKKEPYYNISSNEIISIKKLSLMIKKNFNSKIKVNFKRDGNDGTLFKSLNSNKFRKHFSWNEKYSLEEGIKNTVKWFKLNHFSNKNF